MRHKQQQSIWLCVWTVFCLGASSAAAQEKQPALPDNVQKRAVVIWSEGTRLAGDLYFPKGWKNEDKLPAIVCCNGWGGTKQNTTGRVAARLAQRGYLALAFDYRGWGDSDSKLVLKEKMPRPDEKGEVTVKAQAIREVVDPFDEALDIRHAIDYLMGEPGVDRERIGLWGTSYGGGLVTWTAAHDSRVKCVVAQVAAMGLLSEASRKKAEERATQQARGEIGPIPQDYDKPAKLRGYGNLAKMIGYNALEAASKVKAPILFIDAQKEELFDRLEHGKKAHDILASRKVPTDYRVIKGITHYGVYREGFEEATTLAVEWFDAHLKPAKTLDIYFIDVGRGVGNATLLAAPSGESMLLDAGPSYSALNVVEVMNKAGLKKLDYLVTTHYHADHFGATAELAKQIPILHYVDHGPSIEFGKSDDWWKERRGPWFKAGMGERYDTLYKSYLKVRQDGRHLVVKAGEVMPIRGTEVRVLCAGGKLLADPLPGAGDKNPACADVDKRSEDDAEDAQSIGVLVTLGAFRFVYLADLTWNKANDLFCPRNKVGSVDAYLITHHAQSFPKAMGDYYHGLSACPKSEVHGLRPRVAILSLGAMGHKQGDSAAIETVRKSPGLEDLWQTQFIEAGGEKNHNSPKQFIANIGGKNAEARYIKLSANPDGSFTMLNSRDGFSKHYPVRKKT